MDEDLLMDPFAVTNVMGAPLLTSGVGIGGRGEEGKLEEGKAGSTALTSGGSVPGHLMPTFRPQQIMRCRVSQ